MPRRLVVGEVLHLARQRVHGVCSSDVLLVSLAPCWSRAVIMSPLAESRDEGVPPSSPHPPQAKRSAVRFLMIYFIFRNY